MSHGDMQVDDGISMVAQKTAKCLRTANDHGSEEPKFVFVGSVNTAKARLNLI